MGSIASTMRLASRPRDRGAIAVEFALIMPVILLIVLGVVQYGLYFWAAQGGSTAAREARRAAVGDFTSCAQFVEDVRSRIDAIGVTSTAVVTRSDQNGPGNTATAGNGLVLNGGGKVRSMQLFGFNVDALPVRPIADTTDYELGTRKVIRLVD